MCNVDRVATDVLNYGIRHMNVDAKSFEISLEAENDQLPNVNNELRNHAKDKYGFITTEDFLVAVKDDKPTTKNINNPVTIYRTRLKSNLGLIDKLVDFVRSPITKIFTRKPKTYIAFQGQSGITEERDFEYYTVYANEAADYGNLKRMRISTKDYINAVDDATFLNRLEQEFYTLNKKRFDLLNNTVEGKQIQQQFFTYVRDNYHVKGIDYTGFGDTRYLVKFRNTTSTREYDAEPVQAPNLYKDEEFPINAENPITSLDNSNYYSPEERDALYQHFGTTTVQKMIDEYATDAYDQFDNYLYGNDYNANFVDNIAEEAANNLLRNC